MGSKVTGPFSGLASSFFVSYLSPELWVVYNLNKLSLKLRLYYLYEVIL